jgi:two-component system response regulator AtoC
VADTDVTVLIAGESGVGKEVVARFLHQKSRRSRKPFIKVNCAALPTELLESELFGYEKGAFTGAVKLKPGKFEFANHGTIFLDEIAEMSPSIQAKLLQVLQDGEFSRLGGREDVSVDARVIAATNKDLEQEVRERRFREDLFYRLNVVNIHIPPLRERPEEIPVLAKYFFQKYKRKYNKNQEGPSEELLRCFGRYSWPGNIRELENMIKRVVVLGEEGFVLRELDASSNKQLPEETLDLERLDDGQTIPLKEISKKASTRAERKAILRVLNQTNWNRKKTAKILQISYKALLYKIKECQIEEH